MVLTGSRGPRPSSLGESNSHGLAFESSTVELVKDGRSVFGCVHLDETETSRLLGVGVVHNLGLVYLSDLAENVFEHLDSHRLGQTGNVEVVSLVLLGRRWSIISRSSTSD